MASITARATDVLRRQPGLLGDSNKTGLQVLPRLVADAEAALQAGHLQLAQTSLDTYFAEVSRQHGVPGKAAVAADQFLCRAHFAAGQLVSKLSSSCKGQQLINAVLEAIDSIMKGVELASANPRYSHLVYNGSVHYWHVVRPLQCDKLRHHLLPSQDKLCQALEKADCQPAWRVRHLLSLALCQGSEEGKPDDVAKTLAKALELATSANLQQLRAEVVALQTHQQTLQAAKAAAGKAGGPGAAGKAATTAAAPPPPAAAAAKQTAPAGKRKPGEAQAAAGSKADVDGALALLQWVLSAKPDAGVAEQQLQAALKLVDVKLEKGSAGVPLHVVGRIGWAAAVSGAHQLAEQCTRRASTSQELGPRVWADLTRLLLGLKAAPEAVLGPSSSSSGSDACLDPAALRARREILEGVDEAVCAFLKLGDMEGIHNCAVLAWNAGLPLLQPSHRSQVKPAFTAVAKALEAVGSPWGKLRAAMHLEVAKAEADADSFIKAAKEVSTALSLNYMSSLDMASVCGYERPLDRYLEPMARAAQLRGVAPMPPSSSGGSAGTEAAARPEDDVVLLLERAKDSKSAVLRSDYLQKAINKLALLPAVLPPSGPATTEALQQQLRAARTRTQLWADVVDLAWRPCQLDLLVRGAIPFVLEPNWQAAGDKEMLVLQARMASIASDAAKAALAQLDAELVLPPGYKPCLDQHSTSSVHSNESTGSASGSAGAPQGKPASAGQRKGNVTQQQGSVAEELQRLVADYLLQSMRLAVAAGGNAWLVVNAASAVWNNYLPIMQRERYADLPGVLLSVLQTLLQEQSSLQPDQLVMLAEATAKAVEHTALLTVLQVKLGQQPSMPGTQGSGEQAGQAQQQQPDTAWVGGAIPSRQPWYKSLAEARAATAGLDTVALLAKAADVLELLSNTEAACQSALVRAAAAAEPQGLIQAYARLQQLQGKPVAVPPGAPAAMADTSKLSGLIESLTATAPSTSATTATAAAAAAPAAAAAAARVSSAASSAGKASTAGGKGAAAAPALSKAEQDIRTAMALLSAMPAVNLQLWSQLSRAAGLHGYWLLARECASTARGALPAGKRDLTTVAAASDVPEVGAQGWYWLSVAQMQQGQAVLSLLPAAANSGAAASLSLRHTALQHFATAARLASFIRRADLAEAAARLAHNTVVAPGGLLEAGLTRAACVQLLKVAANALNATRPADIGFQVKINLLLLECMSAADHWQDARQHAEAFHRSLPLAKHKGPTAAAALESLAAWRATCVVKAGSGHAMEDMPRLLSELSTAQAKARAWLAFAQASTSPAEQLSARQAALSALDAVAPECKVDYQLDFAEWLASCTDLSAQSTPDSMPTPEGLLQDALDALEVPCGPIGCVSVSATGSRTRSASGGVQTTGQTPGIDIYNEAPAAPAAPEAAAAAAAGPRWSRATAEGLVSGGVDQAGAGRKLEQLLRVHLLLSQVAARSEVRQEHLLAAQACAEDLLTSSLLTAGAQLPLEPIPQELADVSISSSGVADSSTPAPGVPPSSTSGAPSTQQGAAPAPAEEPQQQQSAAAGARVPALNLPSGSRPGTAAAAGTSRSAALSSALPTTRGLTRDKHLPASVLEWAVWQPDSELLQGLKEAAAAADASAQTTRRSSQSANSRPSSVADGETSNKGVSSAAGSHSITATAQAAAASGVTKTETSSSGGAGGVALGRSAMQAPELLMAHLQELSAQLQTAGHHVAALPVLQLARLVALVTLNSQVATAAVELRLSSLSELLGLTAAASDWLQLAAPDRWPSPEQVQQAEQSRAVQKLARDVLQAHSVSACAAVSDGSGGSKSSDQLPKQVPDTAAFLLAAAQGVQTGTLSAWLAGRPLDGYTKDPAVDNTSKVDAGDGSWGSRVGSAQGGRRPVSSAGARAGAAAAALAAGAPSRSSNGSSRHVQLLHVKPLADLDSWVSIARYLVDHAQYTAGQKLCAVALEQARSSHNSQAEADVLVLQARLALLAQQQETAVLLAQATQEIGGGVQLWRDSVLCYAAARRCMPGRGPADALEALEGGVALLQAVARGLGTCFKPSVLGACASLKLQLAKEQAARSAQQLAEAAEDPRAAKAGAWLHARAVSVSKDAAADAQQAGAVLLQAAALQHAAELLVSNTWMSPASEAPAARGEALQQTSRPSTRQGQGRGSSATASGEALQGRAAALEAVRLLQEVHAALLAVCSWQPGAQQPAGSCRSDDTTALQQSQPTQDTQAAAGDQPSLTKETSGAPLCLDTASCPEPTASTPADRALVSVLVQLSEAELLLARWQLQEGKAQAGEEPQFLRVEGRDPGAVIAFLTASAAAGHQADTVAAADHLESALQHAQQAAAASAGLPALHGAAMLACGRAHMLQAHAALLKQQQQASLTQQPGTLPGDSTMDTGSSSSGRSNSSSSSPADSFDAAWLPWPGCVTYTSTSSRNSSSGTLDDTATAASSSVAGDFASSIDSQSAAAGLATTQGPLSGTGPQAAGADGWPASADRPNALTVTSAGASTPGPLAASGDAAGAEGDSNNAAAASLVTVTPEGPCQVQGGAASAAIRQLPAPVAQLHQQPVQCLQQALHEAVQHQLLHIAERAARALAYCHGMLQPAHTALYLAVAQSCSSTDAMRRGFEGAAAQQHAEVLLWRQLQQLEACGPGSVHLEQVQQLLALLGTTHRRLQVPQPQELLPLLSQLHPHQRLLLVHHDSDRQQLVLSAWGLPGHAQDTPKGQGGVLAAGATPATAAAAAGSSAGGAAGSTGRGSSVSGSGTARGKKGSVVDSARQVEPSGPAVPPAAAAPPAAVLCSMPCTTQSLQELSAAFAAYSRQLQRAIVQVSSTPVPAPAAADAAAAATAGVGGATAAGKKSAASLSSKAAAKDKTAKEAVPETPAWIPPVPMFPQELNEQWQQLMQQFEAFLQPVASLLSDTLKPSTPVDTPASSGASAAKQGTKATSTSGSKADKAAAATAAGAGGQPVPLSLQLLLDPGLCDLPWEALSVVRGNCSSVARCLGLAQLQELVCPPQTPGVGVSDDAAASVPAVLDGRQLSYLVDPLCHMSGSMEQPGCYAAPLIPSFRQSVLEAWGKEWQGLLGVEGQVPSSEQLLRPLIGSQGLLVLTPGRLLSHVGTQAVAELDLGTCTAAVVLDRLDNAAAAAHQTKVDNRKTADERALESPSQTAVLLMLRGVRSVALAALPGTPHTHLHLAANVLRGLSGAAMQPLQTRDSSANSNSTAAPALAADDALLTAVPNGPLSLGEAVVAARRRGLLGFELQALREAGMVVYGLEAVAPMDVASGGSKGKAQRKS